MKTCGPCPTCERMFQSRVVKTYCSLTCYLSSPQLRERLAARNKLLKEGRETRVCPECAATFTVKPSNRKRFCSKTHYRSYMAERFDRWIANPCMIALPQAFDEFLNQQELTCLVEGCAWRGAQLSSHMNFAHGVSVDEFKKMAGFNLTTGVISRPLREQFEARPYAGIGAPTPKHTGPSSDPYRSLESREHFRKAKALRDGVTVAKVCDGCRQSYHGQPHSRYCSVPCRSRAQVNRNRARHAVVTA